MLEAPTLEYKVTKSKKNGTEYGGSQAGTSPLIDGTFLHYIIIKQLIF